MNKSLCESLPMGRTLAILAKSYIAVLTKRLEHLEVERHYTILILIEDGKSHYTQQFICDHLKIDKVSMVRIIDKLISIGFVKRIQNPVDRREYFVELTPKAVAVMPEIHAAIDEVNKAALNGLSPEMQKLFYNQISTIQNNLDALPAQKIFINYKKANKKI
jgi:DNA-binding MarR family transcriptional regulator